MRVLLWMFVFCCGGVSVYCCGDVCIVVEVHVCIVVEPCVFCCGGSCSVYSTPLGRDGGQSVLHRTWNFSLQVATLTSVPQMTSLWPVGCSVAAAPSALGWEEEDMDNMLTSTELLGLSGAVSFIWDADQFLCLFGEMTLHKIHMFLLTLVCK